MYPKVKTVKPKDDYLLIVDFENGIRKEYDIKPLLSKELFAIVKNPAVFKTVKVEMGGYGISWADGSDISEYELWCNGTELEEAQ
jgi:hypothetical protein